jgi:hypothetical protein
MINGNAGRIIPKRLPDFFGAGTLLLAICAGSWTPAVAQQSPAAPVQKRVEALPAPGTYKIDPRHSFAYFSAWHHLVGRVRGRFDQVSGPLPFRRIQPLVAWMSRSMSLRSALRSANRITIFAVKHISM